MGLIPFLSDFWKWLLNQYFWTALANRKIQGEAYGNSDASE